MKLLILVVLMAIVLVVHEWGHYLAYSVFRIPAYVRRSILLPGISPVEPVTVSRWQGLVIALSGFVVSTVLVVLPSVLFYDLWHALLVGSLAGASVDFVWAMSMLVSKQVVIQPVGKPL